MANLDNTVSKIKNYLGIVSVIVGFIISGVTAYDKLDNNIKFNREHIELNTQRIKENDEARKIEQQLIAAKLDDILESLTALKIGNERSQVDIDYLKQEIKEIKIRIK